MLLNGDEFPFHKGATALTLDGMHLKREEKPHILNLN